MLKRNTLTGSFACVPGLTPGRLQTSVLLLLSFVFTFGFSKTAHAQALPTAVGGGQINVFGGFTATRPDYGPPWDKGGMVGGNFMLRRFIFGQPGITVRYSRVTGSTTETFFGGGL